MQRGSSTDELRGYAAVATVAVYRRPLRSALEARRNRADAEDFAESVEPLPIPATLPSRLVAVCKPAPLPTHCRRGQGLSCLHLLSAQLGTYVYPVHRLDRNTTGCLLFGLTSAAAGQAHEALRQGQKRYVALVRGEIKERTPLRVVHALRNGSGAAKEAETVLTPIASCPKPRCTVILAEPRTGRTHQVRRHVKHVCHPIIGDSVHGDKTVNREWREEHDFTRMGLHCLSVRLGPFEGAPDGFYVLSPLPRDMRDTLAKLPLWAEAVQRLPDLAAAPIS
eukprot:Hpha_TRINITY_DN24821_c0_g1::TRINITY_DN24821_c0_g1_i1::g.97293::m.97293/K06175/truC; tRNA pseudouridine65 synthase